MNPLQLLVEGVPEPIPDEAESSSFCGRVWTHLKDLYTASRRYSIVALDISVLVLNTAFLITKIDDDIPAKFAKTTLLMLSTIGVVFIHYSVDMVWKSIQDTKFAIKVKEPKIGIISAAKVLQKTSGIAMTLGSFIAALEGVIGNNLLQKKIYAHMILWGEITIGTGTILTLTSLLITYQTLKRLEIEGDTPTEKTISHIRFCMDKDTLWKMTEQIRTLNFYDEEQLLSILEIINQNIKTQLKITLGGRLIMIFFGDILLSVEKYYTPDSLISALINCTVSLGYSIKIIIEKRCEWHQRNQLDQRAEIETEEVELLLSV